MMFQMLNVVRHDELKGERSGSLDIDRVAQIL